MRTACDGTLSGNPADASNPHFGSVAQVVWPWREKESGPSAPRMRWKQPLLLFLLAGAIRVFTSWRTTPWVLAGIGLALLALARWAPRQATRLEAVTFRLGLFVANGINGFLLAPLYYLAFPLGRWLRHLRRYDPLDKKCPAPEHASFWKTCQPSDPSSYRWQH